MNKSVWLVSLMPPALSLIILRTYLGYFDYGSLFTENLSVAGIFNYVFIFMILTTTGVGLIFFLPSVIFCLFIPKYTAAFSNYRDINGRISLATLISLPLTIFVFFIWAFLSTDHPDYEPMLGWVHLLAGVSMVFLINYFFLRKEVKIAQGYQRTTTRRKTACMLFIGSPLFILIILMCFSFLTSIIIGWVDTKVAEDSIFTLLKLATLISGMGMLLLLPGAVYVNTDHAARSESWFIWFIVTMVCLCLFMTSMYVSSFYPVLINKTMEFSGISDWRTRRFQIDESKIPASHFSRQDWQVAETTPGKRYSVQGIMVYSLNNVRLLCPESVRDSYRNMLHFVPWDREYDKKRANELKKASARCQSFVQGGITRLAEE
ncbi:hypothetical protein MUA04_01140 [Enterobacteriaceae bacterium H11S18]|uniref:hypothetical protein n=1 Tax=Dryocola clanedunensis TaxID=2925396 RepID=UPI0022F10118|nr:hypothetical protein [Dryocola clanedunensis]MCT4708839.1 hypothetical protein [Dryocola clanedunensis]